MVGDKEFLDLAKRRADRDLLDPNNSAQLEAATYAGDSVLQIVAGPGSGKTTVIALRALRHVFVEGVHPENVLITTFTRKAAKELRTRWLDWGTAILKEIDGRRDIDLNKCMIDTLDSVAHQILSDHRPIGELRPIISEPPASMVTLRRVAFGDMYNANKDALGEYLRRHTSDGKPPRNHGEALSTAKRLLERLVQDRVDLDSYRKTGKPQDLIARTLESYREHANETGVYDFALLEEKFLQRLANGDLGEWLSSLKAVLIDEYQDTNPLQEAIYFEIFKNAGLSATIVGDDDQAMYRFRGGSVELFTDFSQRCENATARQTKRVDMVRNFRSTPEIVEFYNRHVTTDPKFASARINPPKPPVEAVRSSGVPVMGMFRPDNESLANDLADFLNTLIERKRFSIGDTGQEIRLPDDGALGDAAFLSHSVNETIYDRSKREVQRQFPSLFREKLESRGLRIFNPRGQDLRTIPEVQKLLGLLLAIEYDKMPVLGENVSYGTSSDGIALSAEARFFFGEWLAEAKRFAASNPSPNDGRGINGFIADWRKASSGKILEKFPREYPALQLLYKMPAWMPGFRDDRERQVWLEAIARIISSASMASPYDMRIRQNTKQDTAGDHVRLSRFSLIRDALVPIAENSVDVDEDIIPSVPRDRLPFMTIHQAKGLEFPLVIVDVGSRFNRDHWKQRRSRFPDRLSDTVRAEEEMAPHLRSPLRSGRPAKERDFDDLVRLYYTACSRPQSALVLVGLRNRSIPNVAQGWRRDKSWAWATEKPYVEI